MSQSGTAQTTQATPYELIGGENAVRALVHRFYELMDTLPEAYAVRKLHAADLSGADEKLFMFFSGWLGGPDLYVQRHGHPRLRARHLPFSIGTRERDEWLLCMKQALDEEVSDADIRDRLYEAMAGLADHMRNRPEPNRPEAD